MKLIAAFLIFSFAELPSQKPLCGCGSVETTASPNMGNMLIEVRGGKLRRIEGKVIFPNYITNVDEPGKEVIVEAYRFTEADKDSEIYQVTHQPDPAASCLTGSEGSFCFDGLPSGKYVLKIGTLKAEGWNGEYVLVNLDRRWWWGWWRSQKLRIVMQAAT